MDHQLQHVKIDKYSCNEIMTSATSCDDSSAELEMELRRGPWTVEEDLTLINYIALHGEGRWNSLARSAGLKRTGKSCRLRWLNYLRPDVRRGNITLEEQLLILELHSRWGNRWSKIAQHLPGRTDNEIKNYWRTRVQKHAKQLKCDVNSKQFKDTMRYLWMPRLVERMIQAAPNHNYYMEKEKHSSSSVVDSPPVSDTTTTEGYNNHKDNHHHHNGLLVAADHMGTTNHNSQELYYHATSSQQKQQQQLISSSSSSSSSSYNGDHHQISPATTVYYLNNGQSGFDFFTEEDHQWMDRGDHLALSEDSLWNDAAAVDNIWNI